MWDAAIRRGREVYFSAGEALIHHGDEARHCYVIHSGEVLVTATTSRGATVVIARRGPGSIVGELGVLDGAARTATVRAIGDVRAVVLTAAELERLLLDHPDFAVAEVRRLSRQLRELTERYAVRNEELNVRVVQLLRTHADATGDPVFRSTREELAGWVGATREAVTRALSELAAEDVVELKRGSVELRRFNDP
jgi:CRP/FNR family transcriptional regulator, cyclic AMP receptor protein